jgi:hypothetical protein
MDEEAKNFYHRILVDDPKHLSAAQQTWDPIPLSPISPSSDYKSTTIAPFSDLSSSLSTSPATPFDKPLASENVGFRRPPVFGPEKVVQDPRIRATHQKIMNDLYMYGGVPGIVCSSFFCHFQLFANKVDRYLQRLCYLFQVLVNTCNITPIINCSLAFLDHPRLQTALDGQFI